MRGKRSLINCARKSVCTQSSFVLHTSMNLRELNKEAYKILIGNYSKVCNKRTVQCTLVQIEIISFRKQKMPKLFKLAKVGQFSYLLFMGHPNISFLDP